MLEDLAGFAPRGLTRALTWIDQHRGGMDCGRLAAIHGDFHRNNILVAPDGRAVVIDWSNVRIADPRADLAWTRLIAMADRWRDDARALLLAYESDTGHGVTGIELFEAAAAVRLLASVLLSLRFGAERQGMKRDAVALMRRDADHTRYVAGILQDRTGLRMPDLDDALEAAFG